MIRANGICILLHMSLPNGRLHTEVMIIIIEHGAQANCCKTHTHTNTHTCSVLLKPQKREKGDEERKRKEVDKRKMTKSSIEERKMEQSRAKKIRRDDCKQISDGPE